MRNFTGFIIFCKCILYIFLSAIIFANTSTLTTPPSHTHTQVYMEPLHRPQAIALIEPHLAKDIFHQIPEIYQLHEKFLGQVVARVEGWTPESKIGDVFVNTVGVCLSLSLCVCSDVLYTVLGMYVVKTNGL